MRTEAFRRRLAKLIRHPSDGYIRADGVADMLEFLPVVSRSKLAKAMLIVELRAIQKEDEKLRTRYRRVADRLERLRVGQALMPHPESV